MPSRSPAQKRTMAAIAHGWRPDDPDIAHIPTEVAREFNDADEKRAKRKKLIVMVMGHEK